ncbi:30S ribosomal protein S19e [Candidatus Burarchaeum australiense]|nr:30S ribosomal protein S19e [Candidatus Burarchaeum australiense]
MVTVYDVEARKVVERAAEKLKDFEAIKAPAWMTFVKSGAGRQRAPAQKNFWQLRCASMLRKLYVDGNKGVSRLRTAYGSKKRTGVSRRHFSKAGGSIIRKGLQQLEKAGLVTKVKKEGRVLTAKGRAFMDSVAKDVKGGAV